MIGPRSTLEQALSGELGALRWALLQRTDDATANHLIIVMGWRANKSFECHMAVATMAKEMGRGDRTVIRKLQHLLDRGFIEDISSQYPLRRTRTFGLCAPAAPWG